MPLLTVALVPGPHQVVLRLSGEIDLGTRAQLVDALGRAAGLGSPQVVVDIAAARFWDCSGLHALCDLTADLAQDGRQCRVVGATAPTRRLIRLADLAGLLELDGALTALRQARVPDRPVRPPVRPAPVHMLPEDDELPHVRPRMGAAEVGAGSRQLVGAPGPHLRR